MRFYFTCGSLPLGCAVSLLCKKTKARAAAGHRDTARSSLRSRHHTSLAEAAQLACLYLHKMSTTTGGGEFGNPLRKFKLVFLGEQSGKRGAEGVKRLFIRSDVRSVLEEVANINAANKLAPPANQLAPPASLG